MAFDVVFTTAGLDALVNAQQTGVGPLVIDRIGLAPTPIAGSTAAMKALTALPNQARALDALGGALASPSLVHLTATDSSEDAYLVKSLGVYTTDDVLLAVYSDPDGIVEKVSAATLMFAFDMPLIDAVAPGTIEIGGVGFSVPPATRLLRGVAELATPEEALAGVDDERIMTPAQVAAVVRRAAWRALFLAAS